MRGERWLAYAATVAASSSLALAGLYPGNNPDTFGHLAQGRQIAELGYVPKLDTWSLLPGPARAWLNYEWLSDLGTWWLFDSFGYVAITLFKCLLLVLTVLCLARAAWLWAGERAVVFSSLVVVSAIPAIRSRLSDRPHVLGIALAAGYLALLSSLGSLLARAGDPRARRMAIASVGALVLLHLVWVNAHGSHLLGLAISGSFVVFGSAAARPWYASVLGLQLIASCISPYGPSIWIDALDHVSDPRYRQLITEWAPWRETDPPWLQLGPALQGAMLAVLLPRLARGPASARACLPIALLLGAACFRSIRFLAEFMLLTAPLVGAGVALHSRALSAPRFVSFSVGFSCLLALVVPIASAHLPPVQPIGVHVSFDGLPLATANVLSRYGKRPRVFAAMQDSWYLMYAAPRSRFVIDGRVPFYGPDYVKRVGAAIADRQVFMQLYDELRFDTLVVRHAAAGEQQMTRYLDRSWSLLVIEDLHATYVREGVLSAAGKAAFPPLVALKPTYDIGWILNTPAEHMEQLHKELARLANEADTSGYRAWVEGVIELAPLRRGGAGDGFRWPEGAADWSAYRRAKPLIGRAAERASAVPVVSALHAELAAIFCDFDEADAALALAMIDGPTREPLLAAQELALRRGERDRVRKVIDAARALPQGATDPWLAQLARGIEHPPACPTGKTD